MQFNSFKSDMAAPVPKCALVVYRSAGESYLFRHAVLGGAAGFRLGAGMPINSDRLIRELDGTGSSSWGGWLPEELLYHDADRMIWFERGVVGPMHFAIGGDHFRVVVPWPNLVYRVDDRGFNVFAYKGRSRPTPQTALYHAPLMNIGGDGAVCAPFRIEEGGESIAERMNEYRSAIHDTNFSHPNHGNAIRGGSDGMLDLFRQLDGKTRGSFPAKSLVGCDLTIEDLIDD